MFSPDFDGGFVRGIVQSLVSSLDLEYSTLTDGVVDGGQIPPENMIFLEGSLRHPHLQDDLAHWLSADSSSLCLTTTG